MSTDERHSDAYLCFHCGNTAPMAIRGHQSVVLKESDDGRYQWLQMFELLECAMCRKPTLRSYLWMEPDGDPEQVVFQRHYPPEPEIPAALPDPIKRAYLAAERIKPVDPNAYGVLAGRMLELIATDQGSKKKKLDQALKDIRDKGKIPGSIYAIAEKLKDLRNVGGHAWLGTLTEAEVPILSELCEAMVFHLYVIPALLSKADTTISALRLTDRQTKGRPERKSAK
jgi:hypothetical protein